MWPKTRSVTFFLFGWHPWFWLIRLAPNAKKENPQLPWKSPICHEYHLKVLQNRRFSAWSSRSGFGAAICVAIVRTSIVFCNSVSADRSGMAASRFLAAAGASVYYCVLQRSVVNRTVVAAWRLRMVLWQQVFLNFGVSCVAASLCKSLLCAKASLCKSLLCVKAPLCQSFLCVKASLCKSLLCVKASLCKSLLCVNASLCKSLLCVRASLCKSLLCENLALCKSFSA